LLGRDGRSPALHWIQEMFRRLPEGCGSGSNAALSIAPATPSSPLHSKRDPMGTGYAGRNSAKRSWAGRCCKRLKRSSHRRLFIALSVVCSSAGNRVVGSRSQYHGRAQDSELRRDAFACLAFCTFRTRSSAKSAYERGTRSGWPYESKARGAALRCAHNELSKSWESQAASGAIPE
jgi:hypothetical protein